MVSENQRGDAGLRVYSPRPRGVEPQFLESEQRRLSRGAWLGGGGARVSVEDKYPASLCPLAGLPTDQVMLKDREQERFFPRSASWNKKQKREESRWSERMEGPVFLQLRTVPVGRGTPLPELGGKVLAGQP